VTNVFYTSILNSKTGSSLAQWNLFTQLYVLVHSNVFWCIL